jgi:1-deoxy-D-xylulose-5-phosphate synthase
MMAFSLIQDYSCAIRYPRDTIPADTFFPTHTPIELGKPEILTSGKKVAIFAYGSVVKQAFEAEQKLRAEGIEVTLVNARFAKPIDTASVLKIAKQHDYLITVEEGTIVGGYGSALSEVLLDAGHSPKILKRLAVPDRLIEHASRADQLKECGIDSASIYQEVKKLYSQV